MSSMPRVNLVPFVQSAAEGCRQDGRTGEAEYLEALVELLKECGDRISAVRMAYSLQGREVELVDIKCRTRGGAEDRAVKAMYQNWVASSGRTGVCPFRRAMCVGRIDTTYFCIIGNVKFFYASTEELCVPAVKPPFLSVASSSSSTSASGSERGVMLPIAKVALTEKANGELTICGSVVVPRKNMSAVVGVDDEEKAEAETEQTERWLVLGSKNVRIALPFSLDSTAMMQALYSVVGHGGHSTTTTKHESDENVQQQQQYDRFSYVREMALLWTSKLCRAPPHQHPRLWKLLDSSAFVGEQVGVHAHIFDAYDAPDIAVFAVLERESLLHRVGCDVSCLADSLVDTGLRAVECEALPPGPALRRRLQEIASGPIAKYGEGVVACTFDSDGVMVGMFKFKNQEYAFDRRLRTLVSNAASRLTVRGATTTSKRPISAHNVVRTDLDLKRTVEGLVRSMERSRDEDSQFQCVSSAFTRDRISLVPYLFVHLERHPQDVANFSDKFTKLVHRARRLREADEHVGVGADDAGAGASVTDVVLEEEDADQVGVVMSFGSSSVDVDADPVATAVRLRVKHLQQITDPLDTAVRAVITKHELVVNKYRHLVRPVLALAKEIASVIIARPMSMSVSSLNGRKAKKKSDDDNDDRGGGGGGGDGGRRRRFGAVAMSAPPGCGKSTLLVMLRDVLEHEHGVSSGVYDRDAYCVLDTLKNPRDISKRWLSDAQQCVRTGGIALVGNCLDGVFADEVAKTLDTNVLVVVPHEIGLKSGGRKSVNPVADPQNHEEALFSALCIERLLARESTLVHATMNPTNTNMPQENAVNVYDDGNDDADDDAPARAQHTRMTLPAMGSTLTMELGASVVFRKYFTTGPSREMVQRRLKGLHPQAVRVAMLRPLPAPLSLQDKDAFAALRDDVIRLKQQVLLDSQSQNGTGKGKGKGKGNGGSMSMSMAMLPSRLTIVPLSQVVISQPGMREVMFVGCTPPVECQEAMAAHVDPELKLRRQDGHMTLAYRPSTATLRKLIQDAIRHPSLVIDVALVARVTVTTTIDKTSTALKPPTQHALQFLATDPTHESVGAVVEKFQSRLLHVTLGSTDTNVLPPGMCRMVMEQLVVLFGAEKAFTLDHEKVEMTVCKSSATAETIGVVVTVEVLPSAVSFRGTVNAYGFPG